MRALLLCWVLGAAACDAPASAPSASAEKSPASSANAASPAGSSAPTSGGSERVGSYKGQKFGAAITESNETQLANVLSDPAKFAGQTIRTTGKVKSVCQSAGCWMEIGDDSGQAHIKMAGHAFVVPKNASGHTAIIQGAVQDGAPKDECGAKDACGGEENGAVAKLEIVATGVEFVD